MNASSTLPATATRLSREKIEKPGALPAALDFELPPELEAGEPPEARGLARDEVRLMVSYLSDDRIIHAKFRELADFLDPGDVLVINTSGTLNAALSVTRADGTPLELRLSTHLPGDLWTVELRQPQGQSTKAFSEAASGETLSLPADATATLHLPYALDRQAPTPRPARLWIASLRLPCPVNEYLARYGFPIRYGYVKQPWPIGYYQTVYATEKGSAEMPSAGRAFTPELITRLVARGVQIVPLLLHTGVASLESHEPPYEEFYRLPAVTALAVNGARADGPGSRGPRRSRALGAARQASGRARDRRVIAVGTTVVRALETATDESGVAHPGEGWTQLVITPERGLRAVDGLLTGLHEPRSSHLGMLEALAGREHLRLTYAQALRFGYLWHEFGDLHLILP